MQECGHTMGFPPVPVPSISLQEAVIKAAHKHDLLAVAHATNLGETMLMLNAGIDGMMHAFADEAPTAEVVEAFKKSRAFLVPTLSVMRSVTGAETKTSEILGNDERLEGLIDEQAKALLCARLSLSPPSASIEFAYTLVTMLKEAEIDIVW
jgi:hypothetical protein